MINFRAKLSEEVRNRMDNHKRQANEAKEMSDERFADMLEYIVVNCFGLFEARFRNTYEGGLTEVYLPEVLRRLRKLDQVAVEFDNYNSLKKKLWPELK